MILISNKNDKWFLDIFCNNNNIGENIIIWNFSYIQKKLNIQIEKLLKLKVLKLLKSK